MLSENYSKLIEDEEEEDDEDDILVPKRINHDIENFQQDKISKNTNIEGKSIYFFVLLIFLFLILLFYDFFNILLLSFYKIHI